MTKGIYGYGVDRLTTMESEFVDVVNNVTHRAHNDNEIRNETVITVTV